MMQVVVKTRVLTTTDATFISFEKKKQNFIYKC